MSLPVDEEDVRLAQGDAESSGGAEQSARRASRGPTAPPHAGRTSCWRCIRRAPCSPSALIVDRIDTQLKAAPVDAGLKLGLVHALLPLSRLNGYPGRVAALRIRHGHVQQPTSRRGASATRGSPSRRAAARCARFIARLEAGAASFQPRPGDDIETLIDGTANVVLRTGPAWLAGQRADVLVAPAGPARAARSALAHSGSC